MATMQTVTIVYMDGKRDVIERSTETPSHFIADGVLNIRGRYFATDEFTWFYFPLCNVRTYATHTVEAVEVRR